ncbi:DUF2937 family protein [Colwelliaceae bacterium BS250]
MLRFLVHTFDRIMFAVNFILAVQIPSFIHQYTQRLSGHLDEAKYQLSNYQVIADQHYQGDLLLLIKRYQTNSEPGIRASGNLVMDLVDRVTALSEQVSQLINNDYLTMIYYFVANIDLSIAKATLYDYQLSVPIEVTAISTGIVVAIVASMIAHGTASLFRAKT